jgi:hypothetical protein
MRHIDASKRLYLQKIGMARWYTIYDNIDEANAHGVVDILMDWRQLKTNAELQSRVVNKDLIWIKTDDKFVPNFYDVFANEIKPLLRNGQPIPTDGCVCEIVQFLVNKGLPHFRVPTGAFTFSSKAVTTELRMSPAMFSPKYNFVGSPDKITKRKRRIIMAWLSPLSPTYGDLIASFMNEYPHYKRRHKRWVHAEIVRKWIDRPWFYRLLKKEFLMAMMLKDLKGTLEKKGIDNDYLAEAVMAAFKYANENKSPKDLLAAVREVRSIVESCEVTEPGNRMPTDELPKIAGAPAVPALAPHIDAGVPQESPLQQPMNTAVQSGGVEDEEDVAENAEFQIIGGDKGKEPESYSTK